MNIINKNIILTVLFSIISFSVFSETVNVSQTEALQIAKSQFENQDVDYYLYHDRVQYWEIFVDAEPYKGWEHDCYLIVIPKTKDSEETITPTIQNLTLPPFGEITPLDVKNRYATNSSTKPVVAKAELTEDEQEIANRTYAVIINGGVCAAANYERYWNDCSFIYQTLRNKYGVPKNNISVIMSDGTDPGADMRTLEGTFVSQPLDLDFDGINDIQHAAYYTEIEGVFGNLVTKLKQDDQLFVYVIDHGGSYDEISESYINLWFYDTMSDNDFAQQMSMFTRKNVNVNVVLGQCYSGGFIDDLTKVGCVVATASSGSEPSWACRDKPYDEFVYQWTSAVNEANAFGVSVTSDIDNNGRVTMYEAFLYAKNNDRAEESPQYISTPSSIGEDLAFNHIAPSVDLFIKDNVADTGKEPNVTTDIFWDSSDVWIRNFDDDIEIHENPYYASDHLASIVYVRVTNRGKKRFDGTNRWVHVNWAQASTGLTVKAWKGRELYNNSYVTGGALTPAFIPALDPGESDIVKLTWALPSQLMSEDTSSENHHFCLLVRILDTHYIDEYHESDPGWFDVKGRNDFVQKNVSVIKRTEISSNTNVFVRNMENSPHSYSLEIRPRQEADNQIFSKAKVEMTMSNPILRAWERGGYQSRNLSYIPATDSLKVTFTSSNSRMENVSLYSNEFEKVSLKFDFHTATPFGTTYTLDLIQRDENGKIVGGETFVVEAPLIPISGPIEINPIEIGDGNIRLEANLDGTEQLTEWTDVNGSIIGNENSVVVSPTLQNNTYSLKVLSSEGELATESITLEPANGIKSATPTTSVNNFIDIEFDNEVSSSNSLISVSSVANGLTVLNMPLPTGAKIVRMDTSSLGSGIYVLSYIVDGQVADTLKFNK